MPLPTRNEEFDTPRPAGAPPTVWSDRTKAERTAPRIVPADALLQPMLLQPMTVRALPIVALLLAAAASAQPGVLDRSAMAGAGVVGGIATAGMAVALVPGDGVAEAEVIAILVGYPAGVALGMSAAGRALGADRPIGRVLRDAAIGSGIGLAAGATVWLVGAALTPESGPLFDRLGVAVLAAWAYGVGPVAVALHGYDLFPAPVAGPGGERSLGVALTVAL